MELSLQHEHGQLWAQLVAGNYWMARIQGGTEEELGSHSCRDMPREEQQNRKGRWKGESSLEMISLSELSPDVEEGAKKEQASTGKGFWGHWESHRQGRCRWQ